jgi:hypothetical protein
MRSLPNERMQDSSAMRFVRAMNLADSCRIIHFYPIERETRFG